MRFGYALLGLVALTSIPTSSAQCSNGLAGVDRDDICCDEGCGVCGGGDCGKLPGGSSNCCLGKIRDSGVMCSESQAAPCIMEDESVCDNGVAGVQSGDICCDASCGTCGGNGCFKLPGGPDSCCSTVIRDAGVMCDTTMTSPCIIASEPSDDVCDNGLAGIQNGDVCCDASCGTCGGSGCAKRPGGPDLCCTSKIRDSAMMCDTTLAAPCIVDEVTDEPTAAPTVEETTAPPTVAPTDAPVPMCSNGFPGYEANGVCCELSCGTCGGVGCGSLPGGSASCCSNVIIASGEQCSVTEEAPCVIIATVSPVLKPTVSAARRRAGNAEDPAAARYPVEGLPAAQTSSETLARCAAKRWRHHAPSTTRDLLRLQWPPSTSHGVYDCTPRRVPHRPQCPLVLVALVTTTPTRFRAIKHSGHIGRLDKCHSV